MLTDLYARKSKLDAGRSVAKQERAWRADCEREGLTPGRVFVDPDLSASRYAKKTRPDYEALLEWIKGRNCHMVSLWEVTRGSRQMHEWVHFLDTCRDLAVLIRVFGDPDDCQTYDPRRQRDREYLLKEGIAAEGEVEKMRARTVGGTLDAAEQGRPPGPMKDGYRREYGARTDESVSLSGVKRREIRQVIDEERAWIYRAAAEGLLEGVPAEFIARVLNAWQVPTATGKGKWAGNALVKAVLSPTLEGHRVLDGKVVARDCWPAILDTVTAARLRRMFEAPVAQRVVRDTRLKYDLSGAIACGLCRRPMGVHRRDDEPVASRRVRVECDRRRGGCHRVSGPFAEISKVVTRMVTLRLRDPDALAVFDPVRDDAQIMEAQADLEALTARRDELYASAAKPGGPSMAMLAATERQLLPQIEAAEAHLRSLRVSPVLRGYDPIDLADRWAEHPPGVRRSVILALTELVLSPVGKAGMWSHARLRESRWRGSEETWGEGWGLGG